MRWVSERVVLVGNSMGGPVCLEVAHSAPERVAGIVLTSPAGGLNNQPLARALVQLVRDVGRGKPAHGTGRASRRSVLRSWERPATVRRARALSLARTDPAHTGAHACRYGLARPADAAVTAVWGRSARLASPHRSIAVIDGAAHAINFSHPGELAHVIGCWLDHRQITDDPDEPGVAQALGGPPRRWVITPAP